MLADLVNVAAYAGDRVVLLRRGHEIAAIVGLEDLDFLRQRKSFPAEPPPRKDDELEAIGRALAEAARESGYQRVEQPGEPPR